MHIVTIHTQYKRNIWNNIYFVDLDNQMIETIAAIFYDITN